MAEHEPPEDDFVFAVIVGEDSPLNVAGKVFKPKSIMVPRNVARHLGMSEARLAQLDREAILDAAEREAFDNIPDDTAEIADEGPASLTQLAKNWKAEALLYVRDAQGGVDRARNEMRASMLIRCAEDLLLAIELGVPRMDPGG